MLFKIFILYLYLIYIYYIYIKKASYLATNSSATFAVCDTAQITGHILTPASPEPFGIPKNLCDTNNWNKTCGRWVLGFSDQSGPVKGSTQGLYTRFSHYHLPGHSFLLCVCVCVSETTDLVGMHSAVTDKDAGCSFCGPVQFWQAWLYFLIQEPNSLRKETQFICIQSLNDSDWEWTQTWKFKFTAVLHFHLRSFSHWQISFTAFFKNKQGHFKSITEREGGKNGLTSLSGCALPFGASGLFSLCWV